MRLSPFMLRKVINVQYLNGNGVPANVLQWSCGTRVTETSELLSKYCLQIKEKYDNSIKGDSDRSTLLSI